MRTSYWLILLLFMLNVFVPQGTYRNDSIAAKQDQEIRYKNIQEPVEETTDERVQDLLKDLVDHSDLVSANVSFYAINLETGEVLAEHGSRKSLTPASTMKVVTTATALMLAGPNHRFKTKVGYNGTLLPDGTLQGDIVITAGGDPTLGSRYFYNDRTAFMEKWVESLKQAGIRRVEGSVVADISIFKPHMPLTWIWGDMGISYGAHAHPLSIYDNEYSASFKTGNPGERPEVVALVPKIPGLSFKMDVVTGGEGEHAVISGSPNETERIITGTLPPNQTSFTLQGAIPNPEQVVAELVKEKLETAGITVTAPSVISDEPVPSTTVDSLLSPTLQEIIKLTNVKSINTYAENLLIHTAIWQGKHPDPATAGKNVIRFWRDKGVYVHGMFMDDGSGLSRSNGVAARHLVGILEQVYRSGYCNNFLKSLPVSGVSGSLTSIGGGTRAAGNMAAKSGYMSRVRSYAGYVKNRKDETIAFAIIVNNYTSTPYAVKRNMEKVMVCLADN